MLNEKYTEYTDRYKSQIRSYDMRLRMNIDVDLTSSTQMQFGIVGVLNESKRPDETIGTILRICTRCRRQRFQSRLPMIYGEAICFTR